MIERLETGMSIDGGPAWVAPDACTLPTAEQPLRVAEFDDLFRAAVTWVERQDATTLRLGLAPDAEVAARAADLAVRESDCCAFFTFTLAVSGARVHLEVTVPEAYTDVLDGLAARVAAAAPVVLSPAEATSSPLGAALPRDRRRALVPLRLGRGEL